MIIEPENDAGTKLFGDSTKPERVRCVDERFSYESAFY